MLFYDMHPTFPIFEVHLLHSLIVHWRLGSNSQVRLHQMETLHRPQIPNGTVLLCFPQMMIMRVCWGGWWQALIWAPNMSQRSHNSRVMFRKNGTANFIRHCLRTPEDQKWLWKLQAEAYKQKVDKKHNNDQKRKMWVDTQNKKINGVSPRLNIEEIRS